MSPGGEERKRSFVIFYPYASQFAEPSSPFEFRVCCQLVQGKKYHAAKE